MRKRFVVLEQQHALTEQPNVAARELVYVCTSDGATLLRDLIDTAWTSAVPAASRTGILQPNDPKNPRFNPATGTAPAESLKVVRTLQVRDQ